MLLPPITQLGYTVPFKSAHAGKFVREDKSKTDITKTKDNQEKANNTKHSKAKILWFNDTRQNEVGLFYNALEPIRGHRKS